MDKTTIGLLIFIFIMIIVCIVIGLTVRKKEKYGEYDQ